MKKQDSRLCVGASVVLTEDYCALFERPDLEKVIHLVFDVRGNGGHYVWKIAPLRASGERVEWSESREVFGDELRVVPS
jgi:hypothetical protein